MRQTTIIIAMLVPFISKAQDFSAPRSAPKTTIVGNVVRDGKLVAEVYYYFEEKSKEVKSIALKYDTTFAIRFKNYKNTDQDYFPTVEFNQTGGKADSIYNGLKTTFTNKNKDNPNYSITFILNYGDRIELKPYKTDNLYFCELDFKDYYIRLTETEVDNLFHKTK
jgi:hypothetical protein